MKNYTYNKLIIFLISLVLINGCSKKEDNSEPSSLPKISTSIPTSITSTTAVFTGNVTNEGESAVTKRGFCWAKNPKPSVSDTFTTNAFGSGEFSFNVSNLSANTIYYLRAYATNSQGTSYSNEVNFKTKIKIGDTGPGGGYVFYLNGSGGGMETAPVLGGDFTAIWGCNNTLIGGTDTKFGSGKANTEKLIISCSDNNSAANRINLLTINGFDDWYLPSKDELDSIYVNLASKGIGQFLNDQYWSSSEGNSLNAWQQDMSLGLKATKSKNTAYRYRAIRNF